MAVPTDTAIIERLALLMEELAEAGQVIGKILRHGMNSHHPVVPGGANRNLLEDELGDVLAAIDLLVLAGDLDRANIEAGRIDKLARVEVYLHAASNKRLARELLSHARPIRLMEGK